MYESYPWPGAYSLKTEIQLFKKAIKNLFKGVFKQKIRLEKTC